MAQQSGTSDTHASVVVARELAARLERAVTDRAFGELYIVAPHDFLESLKSSLSLEVQRRVQQYVDNDFTQWSEAATKVRLDEQLGIRARSFLSFDESA